MTGFARSPPRSSAERRDRRLLAGIAAALVAGCLPRPAGGETGPAPLAVVGDAVARPLTAEPGDPQRGRALVVDRRLGLCLLCHSGPFPEARLQGNLAPSLAGVGARLSTGQLRLRIIDASRVNPDTIMPPYYRTRGLTRVAPLYAGKPILDARQIEDIVAFLATLTQ